MFRITYKIINTEYDDFKGQHGFFQLNCNGFLFGDMPSENLENIIEKVSIYDWFERLTRVVQGLLTETYVVLSDVESYNTWIEFRRKRDKVIISIIEAEKVNGSKDIQFRLDNIKEGEWGKQEVEFKQFKNEVLIKGRKYIHDVIGENSNEKSIMILKERLYSL